MRSLKLLGLTTCCLALAVATAQAQPKALTDAELDGVVAGFLPPIFSGESSSATSSDYSSIFAAFLRPRSQPEVLSERSESVTSTADLLISPNGNGTGGLTGQSAQAVLTDADIQANREAYKARQQQPQQSFPQALLLFLNR